MVMNSIARMNLTFLARTFLQCEVSNYCHFFNDSHFTSFVSIPGKYLVESWPWLLKLPRGLQWFRREPEEYKQRDIKLYTTLLEDVKSRMHDGTAPDCLTAQTLLAEGFVPGDKSSKAGRTMTELDIAYAVASPFGAGIDTVSIM